MSVATRFLLRLWNEIIDTPLTGVWVDNVLRDSGRRPNDPFGDIGSIVARLLELGATRDELSTLMRFAKYEAVFGALYAIDDDELQRQDLHGLFESLLSADPSGREGRPRPIVK